MGDKKIAIRYYSDLLCVWAYVAEVRLEELRGNFLDRVELEQRFVPVFGNTDNKIGQGWAKRGGWKAYADHVRQAVDSFAQLPVHPQVWAVHAPPSSHGAHAFVKAAAVLEQDGEIDAARSEKRRGRTAIEELAWQLRLAFFRDGLDIARLDVQLATAHEMNLPADRIRELLENGRAFAALAVDYEAATRDQVKGSPTFVLNEGRQKLYGNVGYGIIEANIQELLRDRRDMASWC